jgi:hypothetical protein
VGRSSLYFHKSTDPMGVFYRALPRVSHIRWYGGAGIVVRSTQMPYNSTIVCISTLA